MFLYHLGVMNWENELDLHAALVIGYAATLPYTWPVLYPVQLKIRVQHKKPGRPAKISSNGFRILVRANPASCG